MKTNFPVEIKNLPVDVDRYAFITAQVCCDGFWFYDGWYNEKDAIRQTENEYNLIVFEVNVEYDDE